MKSNIFFKPNMRASSALLLFDAYLGANVLTLTSLRSELLDVTNLETDKPRGSST